MRSNRVQGAGQFVGRAKECLRDAKQGCIRVRLGFHGFLSRFQGLGVGV